MPVYPDFLARPASETAGRESGMLTSSLWLGRRELRVTSGCSVHIVWHLVDDAFGCVVVEIVGRR